MSTTVTIMMMTTIPYPRIVYDLLSDTQRSLTCVGSWFDTQKDYVWN